MAAENKKSNFYKPKEKEVLMETVTGKLFLMHFN